MAATFPTLTSPRWRHAAAPKWAAAGIVVAALLIAATPFLHSRALRPASLHHPLTAAQRASQAQCLENAQLMHDVGWAASCKELENRGQGDGYAECDLPNAQAGQLNLLLAEAQQLCFAEAKTAAR